MTEDEMWLRFACAAISGYEVPADFDGEDTEDLANDIADVAEAVADVMLEAFKERFKPDRRPRRSSRGSRGKRGAAGGETPPETD
jgi:hypothetical protein